ncbi:MAG: chemotaxis protein CheW [Rivularia sp. (in: cyanobacteria)]
MNASQIELLTQHRATLGDGYLQFKLNQSTTAVLQVKFTQEVVVLPIEAITSIPNTSVFIIGLMNWRNKIIWVVDLPKIFGLESDISRIRQCNIITIRHQTETIGLMVPLVKGTVRFDSNSIQSAQNQVETSLLPYLKGCIWCGDEPNLVLNIQAILKSLLFDAK